MFTYLLTGSFGEYFLFYGLAGFILYIALAWRYGFHLSKILSVFPPVILVVVSIYLIISATVPKIPVLVLRPEFGTKFAPYFYDDISLQNWYSLPLFPLTEERGYFRFRILANHFASIFFSPCQAIRWDYYMSIYPILYPSGHRVQISVGFHSDLDLLIQPREIDLHYYSSF